MIKKIIQFINNRRYKNPPMVSYWQTKESVLAKVTTDEDGAYIMIMEGEKYPFPGFPRGVVLYKQLSKLKHEIKNQIFNDSWAKLEGGMPEQEVINDLKLTKAIWRNISELTRERKHFMLPPERMQKAVREIHRAMTTVEGSLSGERKEQFTLLKETLCFILQEDDAYRFRVQWCAKFFRWWRPSIKAFEMALSLLEHAEVVGDMKERVRLWRRISLLVLKDPVVRWYFDQIMKEVDWKKVRLSDGDKYHFRAKYFKCDYPEYQY
jgi:hypothetical protein